jgi:hypothetical protein
MGEGWIRVLQSMQNHPYLCSFDSAQDRLFPVEGKDSDKSDSVDAEDPNLVGAMDISEGK